MKYIPTAVFCLFSVAVIISHCGLLRILMLHVNHHDDGVDNNRSTCRACEILFLDFRVGSGVGVSVRVCVCDRMYP